MEVIESFFTPEDVYGADSAFFTGTATEVVGVKSLDGHEFALPWEETMGWELAKAYKRTVTQNEYQLFDLV